MIKTISGSYRRLLSKITIFKLRLFHKSTIGANVFFDKRANIFIAKNCKLIIGNNVRINSNNKKYHINMHSACKILMDRPNAEIIIGENTRIHGTCIHAYSKIHIGKNCLIAANTQIIDGNGHHLSMEDPSNRINTIGTIKPIIIEDNVWIGANVIILPGVVIGNGAVISANSVVNADIPPMTLAMGNPAVVFKTYN